MNDVDLVVRLFNIDAGKPDGKGGFHQLDQTWIDQKTKAINKIWKCQSVNEIAVLINADPISKHCEAMDGNGNTPTGIFLKKAFAGKNLTIHYVKENWGLNLGSGQAVQLGVDYLKQKNSGNHIMIWSPELDIDAERLEKALIILEKGVFEVVGFLRQHYSDNEMWCIPQHTGMVATTQHWNQIRIPKYADGIKGVTIPTSSNPNTLVAGMDDFARLIEVYKRNPELKICMIGKTNPINWNIDFNNKKQKEKIERQSKVVNEWCRKTYSLNKEEDTSKYFESFRACVTLI